jgi:hypothetical protein
MDIRILRCNKYVNKKYASEAEEVSKFLANYDFNRQCILVKVLDYGGHNFDFLRQCLDETNTRFCALYGLVDVDVIPYNGSHIRIYYYDSESG